MTPREMEFKRAMLERKIIACKYAIREKQRNSEPYADDVAELEKLKNEVRTIRGRMDAANLKPKETVT